MKGRVIGHADVVVLENIEPKVSEAGRQRVLREKRKNVHAGITGRLVWVDHKSDLAGEFKEFDAELIATCNNPVTYNPYKFKTFVKKSDTTHELLRADVAMLHSGDRSVMVGGDAYVVTRV